MSFNTVQSLHFLIVELFIIYLGNLIRIGNLVRTLLDMLIDINYKALLDKRCKLRLYKPAFSPKEESASLPEEAAIIYDPSSII